MKLLIATQAVDQRDPVLGFFVRWIEEFAKHCGEVTVICLRAGEYTLPPNVRVAVLPPGRIRRALRLLSLSFTRRHHYDRVFVHMNPEYMVVAGLLWRLLGKRASLWYTHKSVDLKLRLATLFAQTIFTASEESFRIRNPKVRVVGHGIDVNFFSPDPSQTPTTAVLSAGRLSKVKRHDLVIRAAAHFPQDVWVAGDGPERDHLEDLASHLSIGARVQFLGPLTQEELRERYRTAGIFVHASETGSLDKMVLEALACGLPVITTSESLRALPVTVAQPLPRAIAKAVTSRAPVDSRENAAYVRDHHSLTRLIPDMLQILETP